jgi:uncharacterized protein (DUF488 family)
MILYTIGFTKKSAEEFFTLLRNAKVRAVIDIRLNNSSQLAGFAKSKDLAFFSKELLGASYHHLPILAPTKNILSTFKSGALLWPEYEQRYHQILEDRKAEFQVDKAIFENGCLLCSEHEPDHCHRRLAAEYLNEAWGNAFEIVHLK